MRRHRDTVGRGWSDRLLSALRAFNGIYENAVIEEIKRFGGIERIFAHHRDEMPGDEFASCAMCTWARIARGACNRPATPIYLPR